MNAPIYVTKSETLAPNYQSPASEYTLTIHGTVLDEITPEEVRQLRDMLNMFLNEEKEENHG